MKLQLVRHATLWLEYAGKKFLIDPMFSDKGANPPIVNSTNERRNPLVPLPQAKDAWISPDAVIVTHLHKDHWDPAAAASLAKAVPVLCQPGDASAFHSEGFTSVTEIDREFRFNDVSFIRTSGRHGHGEIGQRMGRVSGFIIKAEGEPTLYLAGDTVWCDDVKIALDQYRPDWTVVNAGGAQFSVGDPITMNADDIISLCCYAPYTKVVAVHMDTINHCLVTREDLQKRLSAEKLLDQVTIPGDGDWV